MVSAKVRCSFNKASENVILTLVVGNRVVGSKKVIYVECMVHCPN